MIEVDNLHKHFGAKVAVDGVSFTVNKGEVLGFLGPNGAGKSTTMRMVTGFLPATEGSVSIGGADIEENEIAAKSKIGYLAGGSSALLRYDSGGVSPLFGRNARRSRWRAQCGSRQGNRNHFP